jgi:LysM repeat protein
MKNQRFVGLLLAAHITLGAAVLLLSGCQSTMVKKGPKPGDNVALAQGTPRPINPAFNSGLSEPTRPTETATPTGEPGSVLEPVAAAPAPVSEEYTVAKGDTLSRIAKAHNISVVELRNANSLSTDALKIGQKLTIPAPAGSASSMTAEGGAPSIQAYVVVKGDTLARVAKMYGVSVADLKAANNLTTGTLKVGQKLTLPAGAVSSPKWVAPAVPKHTVKASGHSYKVVKGDTVGSIASRAGVKTQDLMDLNGISEPRRLRVGMTLKLPAGAKAISSKSVAASGKGKKGVNAAKSGSSAAAASAPAGGNMLQTDIFAEPTAPVSSSDTTAPASTPAPASVQAEGSTTGSGLENLDAAPATPTVPVQSDSGTTNPQP